MPLWHVNLIIHKKIVTKDGFVLPEAKTRITYKSRNCILVGSDFGPNSFTDSGYPRIIVKDWKRGTPLEDATTMFQGQFTDASVFVRINDQRHIHQGPIYQVHGSVSTVPYLKSPEMVKKTY